MKHQKLVATRDAYRVANRLRMAGELLNGSNCSKVKLVAAFEV